MPRKYQTICLMIWICLSIFVMIASYLLDLGNFQEPGPGFMPFLFGLLLCMVSLCKLVVGFLQEKRGQVIAGGNKEQEAVNYTRLSVILISLFAYAWLFESLGFLIATFLVLLILFRILNKKWFTVVLTSALTTAITYVLFTNLGVNFPKGILKGIFQ